MADQPFPNVVPCPGCGAQDATKLNYVWWGGMIAPRLMNLARCNRCSLPFGGVSGKNHKNTGWLMFGGGLIVTGLAIQLARFF